MTRLRSVRTLGILALTLPAQACTVCDSSTGRGVRAGLFDGHFLHTSLLIASPFPVFAAVLVLLHFGMPELRVTDRSEAPPELVL